MFLYLSKFQENGGVKCGYLLKPQWMLANESDSKGPSPKKSNSPQLSIEHKVS